MQLRQEVTWTWSATLRPGSSLPVTRILHTTAWEREPPAADPAATRSRHPKEGPEEHLQWKAHTSFWCYAAPDLEVDALLYVKVCPASCILSRSLARSWQSGLSDSLLSVSPERWGDGDGETGGVPPLAACHVVEVDVHLGCTLGPAEQVLGRG